MDNVKTRITPEQEKMMNNVLGDDDWKFFDKVVDTLVAENVDLSSAGESGLTPMEYIFDMYERHLLDSGQLFMRIVHLVYRVADLNVNTYKAEDNLSDIERENIRSSLLHHILEVLKKKFRDCESSEFINLNSILWSLIDCGARVWKPCYNPWDQKNEDGYIVEMWPAQRNATLFYDNMGRPTGNADSITIEAEDGHTTKIDISGVEGLKAWHEEYKINRENFAHDWQSWKKRGLSLAKTLAASFPTTISLFFPNFSEATLGHADPFYCALKHEHTTLCTSGKPIRIFP